MTPTLVLVGERDRMVTADFTQRVMAAGRPEHADLRVVPGAGHMLFADSLGETLPVVTDWLRARVPVR